MEKHSKKTRDNWGGWEYRPDTLVLQITTESGWWYEIDLEASDRAVAEAQKRHPLGVMSLSDFPQMHNAGLPGAVR